MTTTPRTDAIAHRGYNESAYIAEMTDTARELERELAQWQGELSKVMPPDFKDWWHNSKAEWPLVARLVIEGKNRERSAADEYTARIERELAGALSDLDFRRGLYKLQSERLERTERELAETISVRDSLSNAADKLEEDKEYNARLCDTLREGLKKERALADRLGTWLSDLSDQYRLSEHNEAGIIRALMAWKEARKP